MRQVVCAASDELPGERQDCPETESHLPRREIGPLSARVRPGRTRPGETRRREGRGEMPTVRGTVHRVRQEHLAPVRRAQQETFHRSRLWFLLERYIKPRVEGL